MRQVVHDRELELTARDGTVYVRMLVWAEPERVGTWRGWIEFLTSDKLRRISTDSETTQSTLEDVAYWASGLQPIYLEGALERAQGRSVAGAQAAEPSLPLAHVATRFRLITADPEVPFRLMGTRTLVPGSRRYVHNGGIIVYEGPAISGSQETPTAYHFLAQFGSENAAAMLANTLWSDLHGLGVQLQVEGADVPMQNAAIKEALLGALVS